MTAPKDDDNEKTEVLTGNFETLNKELAKAKEQAPCLIMIRGTRQGHRFFITMDEMTLGRDPAVEITISDPSISRRHSVLHLKGDEAFISDLGSSNGTVINGKKVAKGSLTKLAKEDMIRLGNSIFKFLPAGELEILVYGNLESAAHTDALTKIYNRRYLLEALEADIDHFKMVNDTYGHEAGDHILKELCNLVRAKFIRPKDVFARIGGEEFVILLANTGAKDGADISENVRAAVEAHAFIYEGKKVPITISIGVAEVTSSIESSKTLLKVADKALYQAKEEGRNRVVVSS